VIAVVLLAVAVSAHNCLLNPIQRGGLPKVLPAAAPQCALTSGAPCGGAVAGAPVVSFKGGSNATIVFQKNQDHYKAGAQGVWTIGFSEHTEANLHIIGQLVDDASPTLTSYSVPVTIPKGVTNNAVIQVVYDAQGISTKFYQCADVSVF